MWLRSDKRELRIRNQTKTKFLINHRKKRKRPRNQYSKTIKLMKNEKKAVIATSQYSEDDLTLYSDKSIEPKKHNVSKKLLSKKQNYIESLSSFTSESKMNQFGPIAFDLNTLEIDLTSSNAPVIENHDHQNEYSSSTDNFQTLDTQFNFECNYTKSATEIPSITEILIKSKRLQIYLS